ncbi:hypothetical protein E3O55_09850 [Cryobacterium sp. MDB1-18-2]|uniref:hypothetical protein n=1 Tax=unclassified Cryobacterium TaxID=2649013 RepID=UPI00106B2E27|nr:MULTISPECIES: hypothetical protein [unclassified Cryobacterium]TFC29168.1 hypothetical protein E3O55_09850 [Cryobacterium sp. MDB1-18-2]TFC45530.1 hypothetical protein E3O50_03520 [Cryobacterium sp. MDB1-18-1]
MTQVFRELSDRDPDFWALTSGVVGAVVAERIPQSDVVGLALGIRSVVVVGAALVLDDRSHATGGARTRGAALWDAGEFVELS